MLSRPSVFALLMAVALVSLDARLGSQSMTVTATSGDVRVQAPGFRFLSGQTLARLKDGLTVRAEIEMRVLAAPGAATPAAQNRQTFVLSYDLWEERFAASISGTGSRSVSHLTAAAAEAWCIQQLSVPISGLGPLRNEPFWIRLDAAANFPARNGTVGGWTVIKDSGTGAYEGLTGAGQIVGDFVTTPVEDIVDHYYGWLKP